jgi:hypothetical protein
MASIKSNNETDFAETEKMNIDKQRKLKKLLMPKMKITRIAILKRQYTEKKSPN